jgi:signal transduction histidine kinase
MWDIQGSWKKAVGSARENIGKFAGREHASPERQQTDEGLRNERHKTDEALAKWQDSVDEHADAVVDQARDTADAVVTVARANADAVLEAARDRADGVSDDSVSSSAPQAIVAEERLLEDEALQTERSEADETLRMEREKDALAVSRLVPLEREFTDQYLHIERARSDNAVSNRDDFLGLVTHDLRDLLGGIVISTSLLSTRAGDGEAGALTLAETGRIERYVARMRRLIGDLSDVASIDAGKFPLTLVRGDSTSLLTEVADAFQARARAKDISLDTAAVKGPLPADFDRDRMLQVLVNLMTNALKFTPKGGRITLSGERCEDKLQLCVSDTGSGIPEDSLESIFERFWQLGKNDRRGLGLGLYISRCIVEAHGGRIWAESRPGEGSKVCFTLPPAPAQP